MIKKSIKIILRRDKQRPDSTCPVYLQIIINREVLKKAINEYVSEKFWDAENGKVKKGFPDYVLINEMIDHKLTEIRKIINSLELSGQKVSITILKDFLERQSTIQNVHLFEFWKKQIENWKCIIKHSTIKNYNVTYNRLREFTKDKDVNLNDIDLDFIERFDAYLKIKVGNTLAGANTRHKCLKAILRAAIAKGLLQKSPYTNFKLTKIEGRRVYLTPDELRVIEAFKFPVKLKHLDKVRDMYLFSCYTGLRISDVTNLKWGNIKGDVIEIQVIKTSKPLRTGIIDKSRALLDKYLNHDSVSVFPKISHQKINKGLKQMTLHLGIDKELSFHTARHTFASLLHQMDIDVMTIKELLGHANYGETQNYIHSLESSRLSRLRILDQI